MSQLTEPTSAHPQGKWFASTKERIGAYVYMIFVDHGFFRYVYLNFHKVGSRAFRSAQPAPHHIKRYVRAGVRTVVNLRSPDMMPQQRLEMEACENAGLAYRAVKLRSREAPRRETLEAVAALLNDIEYPAVFHCKSGADRVGLMSALYLIFQENAPISVAKKQLSILYGHFSSGPTGALDAFLKEAEAAEKAAAPSGEPFDFLEWARSTYDCDAVNRAFKSSDWVTFLIDRLLRRE